MGVKYLSVEEIVEFNLLVLELVKVKKSDKHQVLSIQKISSAIDECRETKGGIYAKAAALMRALSRAHAFGSGNRRTAFIATKDFVLRNGEKFQVPDDSHYASVLRGIREGYYSDVEIAEWIQNGRIKQFTR